MVTVLLSKEEAAHNVAVAGRFGSNVSFTVTVTLSVAVQPLSPVTNTV